MKFFRNILSLSSVSVTVCILSAIAVGFSACGTVSTIPIDDAYHWSDETSSTPASVTPTTSDTIEATPKTSSVEYLNVQDTTVTVRIKK